VEGEANLAFVAVSELLKILDWRGKKGVVEKTDDLDIIKTLQNLLEFPDYVVDTAPSQPHHGAARAVGTLVGAPPGGHRPVRKTMLVAEIGELQELFPHDPGGHLPDLTGSPLKNVMVAKIVVHEGKFIEILDDRSGFIPDDAHI